MEKEENIAADGASTKIEEAKDESKSETKEVSFPEFVCKSFISLIKIKCCMKLCMRILKSKSKNTMEKWN